jgi:Ni,Fe-hydrogenase I small subunit
MHGYSVYKLTTVARDSLLAAIPPKFNNVVADHITVEYNISFDIPLVADVEVIAVVVTPKLQAAIVTVNGQTTRPDGELFHITISHVDIATPADTKEAIKLYDHTAVATLKLDVVPEFVRHQ